MPETLPTMPIFGVEDKPQITFDGETATIVLHGPGGLRVPLQVGRDSLATVSSRLTRAFLLTESIAKVRGVPAEVRSVRTDRVNAQAPIASAPVVLLSVLTYMPLLQHFELSPEQADTLARELRDAAAEARKNAGDARH